MKTFETEKGNIPDGATHYMDESVVHRFSWGKYVGDDLHLRLPTDKAWVCVVDKFFSGVMELIPQPEKVEWDDEGLPPVGARCEAVFVEHEHKGYGEFLVLGYHSGYVWMEYVGELSNKSKHYTSKVDLVKFRKPETEQQREDRERLEAAYDLYLIRCHAVNHPITYEFHEFKLEPDAKNGWLAVVDKTNYRKGRVK